MSVATRDAADAVAHALHPLTGAPADLDAVLDIVGDAHFVLLGEASHGTHEFYRVRAEITKRLIRERGFQAVAVEADWPDAYRVNRFVRGLRGDADATEALEGFTRFPRWMWRNADVLDVIGWLRAWNDERDQPQSHVGFYGLDLYSMHSSVDAVLGYLATVDPEAARRARERYACLDHAREDPHRYGHAAHLGLTRSCEDEVIHQLTELLGAAAQYTARDGRLDPDAQFAAEQNARVIVNAEQYYRTMFRGRHEGWNVRDTHMEETLHVLGDYLEERHGEPKVVVWAHNSHLGDARATEMGDEGELNLGQLVRMEHGHDARLIGFSTYAGTVTAADDWDGPAERMDVRPALDGSYESLFHEALAANFLVDLRDGVTGFAREAREALDEPRLERAIGVIYRPRTERLSHYFRARLPRQFDAVLHLDRTRAVEPMDARGRPSPALRRAP